MCERTLGGAWLVFAGLATFLGSCGVKTGQVEPGTERGEGAELREGTDNPIEAYRWRRMAWVDEHGQIAPGAYQRAMDQRREMLAAQDHTRGGGINQAIWTSRGPSNIGGRTRSLIIDPSNPNRLIAGAVSGGIWTSLDGGLNWTPNNDFQDNLAICCMAQAPSNASIMFAGTGEELFAGDGVHGEGMYISTDTGETWSKIPSTASWAGKDVLTIAVHPTNPDYLLVGRMTGGVFRSTNRGATWSNPLQAQAAWSIAFDPSNPNNCVAGILNYSLLYGGWYSRCSYSTNGGQTWTTSTGLDIMRGYGRIQLAYAPSSPNIVYATYTDGKIYKSTDGGKNFIAVTTSGVGRTDVWAAPLWVDPTNPDFLVTGTGPVLKSVDGGVTLTGISNGYINTVDPHPDIQAVVADPGFDGVTNTRVYITTDGAVYRAQNIYTATSGSGWERLDKTYRTTQFYSAVGDGPTGRIYGGTQDNGCLLLKPGSDVATLPFGGDGGFSAIDSLNPNYMYGEFIYLQVHRAVGSGGGQYIVSGLTDAGNAANFIAPLVLDPNNPQTLLGGGNSLWRTTSARGPVTSWKSIRAGTGQYLSAIAVAKGDSATIWIAQNDAKIYKTTDGTQTTPIWAAVDDNGALNPLPNRFVTRILIDPQDKQTVYVCFGGFTPDNIWKTTDGGTTWAPVTGAGGSALPSTPVRGLARHPLHKDWLYAGTEIGVFTTTDGGAHWTTTNDGPANVCVHEINFLNNSTSTLVIGTHGRGIFTAEVVDCRADTDHNGFVDTDDFDQFVALFEAGDERADIDASGFVDTDDYDVYVTAFEAGC